MDLDLVTQLAIIAEEESAAIYHFTLLTLSALAVLLALLLAVTIAPKSCRKLSFWLFLAISAIVMIGAVQKPWKPRVEWPAGVTDNGSIIDTNTWATLEFEASGISVGLRAPDSGVKRCEHGARSAECLQRAV